MPTDHDDPNLVQLLDQIWHTMGALGAELSEQDWKAPTEVPGWSVQDNLAHIAGMESRLLGRPEADHAVPADLPHVKNPIGEANEVFVALPSRLDDRLKAEGASYYPWMTNSLPNGVAMERDATLVRLVTSFTTTADEVDRFVAVARAF